MIELEKALSRARGAGAERMLSFAWLVLLVAASRSNAQGNHSLGPMSFTASGTFPASVYDQYYNDPGQTNAQVQPVIIDPFTHEVYPPELTDPKTIPQNNSVDPRALPPKASASTILAQAIRQIELIVKPATANSPFLKDACAACQSVLLILKFVALAAPEEATSAVLAACNLFPGLGLSPQDCQKEVGPSGLGPVITQVLANADTAGYDGQLLCQTFFKGVCPMPPTAPLNLTGWFAKPKPNPLPAPRQRSGSGKRLKVLHLSDFHIDPRYATGTEANCTLGLCCREGNVAFASPNVTMIPAPRFGAHRCDTPFSLALAALQAIPVLSGTQDTGFAFTVYTGDLVSHDTPNQVSRDYVMYTETVVFNLFKKMLGSGPVYAVLGNHDTHVDSQDAPHSLGGELGDQFSWNYDHVARLWEYEGWIPSSSAAQARAHYGAYSVRRQDGLRIITLNTDFWYQYNWFNHLNATQPDVSGMLRFLTDELQDAEDVGDRVWILGHVLSGWDGQSTLANPSNLFYQIVDRFSPHVIANIFWGHTHEDHFTLFYANNATNMSAETAQTVSWIGPSLTPFTDLNSGFRVYEVDSNTFDVLDAYTFRSDVNTFSLLDNQTDAGPTYVLEYNTRETYGRNISGWGLDDPLNATWWHLVTEAMEANPSLVTTFNNFQGKQSILSKPCTGDCIPARICYMRSGSSSIARQNCKPGFGTVQRS